MVATLYEGGRPTAGEHLLAQRRAIGSVQLIVTVKKCESSGTGVSAENKGS